MTYNVDWSRVKGYQPENGFNPMMWQEADPRHLGMFEFAQYFDVEAIDDNGDTVTRRQCFKMTAVSSSITSAMLVIGMNRITPQNIDEFFARCTTYYNIVGDPLRKVNPTTDEYEDYRWTYSDLQDHIGLSSNASTMNKTEFRRHMASIQEDRAVRATREARRNAEASNA